MGASLVFPVRPGSISCVADKGLAVGKFPLEADAEVFGVVEVGGDEDVELVGSEGFEGAAIFRAERG